MKIKPQENIATKSFWSLPKPPKETLLHQISTIIKLKDFSVLLCTEKKRQKKKDLVKKNSSVKFQGILKSKTTNTTYCQQRPVSHRNEWGIDKLKAIPVKSMSWKVLLTCFVEEHDHLCSQIAQSRILMISEAFKGNPKQRKSLVLRRLRCAQRGEAIRRLPTSWGTCTQTVLGAPLLKVEKLYCTISFFPSIT